MQDNDLFFGKFCPIILGLDHEAFERIRITHLERLNRESTAGKQEKNET